MHSLEQLRHLKKKKKWDRRIKALSLKSIVFLQEYLQREHAGLRKIIEHCGGRYHVINNRQTHDREQVYELLEKVSCWSRKPLREFYQYRVAQALCHCGHSSLTLNQSAAEYACFSFFSCCAPSCFTYLKLKTGLVWLLITTLFTSCSCTVCDSDWFSKSKRHYLSLKTT